MGTVQGTTVSVKQWHGHHRKLEMDDTRINMDKIVKVAKSCGLYYIRESKMDYIVNSDKMK